MGLYQKRFIQGFTIIELVVVIIVLGVLSAVAIPKFVNRSGFEDHTLRDQLISRLRLVQLQGMNADPSDDISENACYWLVVKNNCFYHEHSAKSGANCIAPAATNVCDGDSYNEYNALAFSAGMLSEKNYRFSLEGKLVEGNVDIDINGDNSLSITIEDEGFIHE